MIVTCIKLLLCCDSTVCVRLVKMKPCYNRTIRIADNQNDLLEMRRFITKQVIFDDVSLLVFYTR